MECLKVVVTAIAILVIFSDSIKGTVRIENLPTGIMIIAMRNVTMTCTVSPLLYAVSWLTPGTTGTTCICEMNSNCQMITTDPRYSCSSQGEVFNLFLTNVAEKDEGTYTCRHAAFPNEEEMVDIVVIDDPVSISSVNVTSPTTSPVTVTENVTSTFVCETSEGRPQAVIQWFKRFGNGSALAISGGSHSILPNDSRVITRSKLQYTPTRDDQGYMLFCTAYNIDPASKLTSTNQVQLFVQYVPDSPAKIDGHINGSALYIIDGKPQTLTCSIQGGVPLASVTWSCFNGTVVNKSSGDMVSMEILFNASPTYDGKMCICEFSHVLWSSRHQYVVVIEVLYPPSSPTFTLHSQPVSGSVSVIEGRNMTVLCSSSGNPSPRYTWTPRGSSTSDDALTLTNITISDQGNISCTATNTMIPSQGNQQNGTSNSTIYLDVLFPPRSLVLRYGNTSGPEVISPFRVVRGDNVTVYCQAHANPPPSYYWTNQTADNSRLTVASIREDQTWTCSVTNQMNPTENQIRSTVTTQSTTTQESSTPLQTSIVTTAATTELGTSTINFSVEVLYGPSVPALTYHNSRNMSRRLDGGSLSVIERSSFTVVCNGSNSKPAPSYSWSGNMDSTTDILHIGNISRESDGILSTCTTKNVMNRTYEATETGTSSIALAIRVLYPPIVNRIGTDTAIENSTFSKICSFTPGNPAKTEINWTKPDSTVVNGATLTISNITKDSAGTYTCTAKNTMTPTGENSVDGKTSDTLELVVYYPATITNFTNNGRAGNGPFIYDRNATIVLRCEVDSNPASQITLSKDGSVIRTYQNVQEVTHSVVNISCFGAGIYSCAAMNLYNDKNAAEATHQVFVTCLPHLINTVNNRTFYTGLGESVTLHLAFTAYPLPDSDQWFKVNSESNWTRITEGISSTSRTANLTIANITKSDFGQYTVIVKNTLGTLEHLFFISARRIPDSPHNITVEPQHDSSVVHWTPGHNGGLSQTFYVEYRKETDQAWIHVDAGDETSALYERRFGELVPSTNYVLRMYAENGIGKSKHSEEIAFKTLATSDSKGSSSSTPRYAAIGGGVGAGLVTVIGIVVFILVIRRRKMGRNPDTHAPLKQRNDEDTVPHSEGNIIKSQVNTTEIIPGHYEEIGDQAKKKEVRYVKKQTSSTANKSGSDQGTINADMNQHRHNDHEYDEIQDSTDTDAVRVKGPRYEEVKRPPKPLEGAYAELKTSRKVSAVGSRQGTGYEDIDHPPLQKKGASNNLHTTGTVQSSCSGQGSGYEDMDHTPTKKDGPSNNEHTSCTVNAADSGQCCLKSSGYETMKAPAKEQTDVADDVPNTIRARDKGASNKHTRGVVQSAPVPFGQGAIQLQGQMMQVPQLNDAIIERAASMCRGSDSWSGYENVDPMQNSGDYEKLRSSGKAPGSQGSQKYVNLRLDA